MSEQAEPMVVTPTAVVRDDLNPPDRDYWVYDEMCQTDKFGIPVPNYSVQDAAKVFFARSADWLRWRGRPVHPHKPNEACNARCRPDGYFVLDGMKIEEKRTEAGARVYTLADIERMAHALAQNDALDGLTLTKVIMIVKWQARLYGVIE
jgi:hypothetical protein